MLERAARCLDSRAPTQWHSGCKAFQSRRQLHCAFWRHGAADLDLRTYCLESVARLFEHSCCPNGKDPNGIHTGTSRTNHDFPFYLDFLYPLEAQDLLHKWSFKSRLYWRRKSALANTFTGPRAYASSARPTSVGTATLERPEQSTGVGGSEVVEESDSVDSVDSSTVQRLQELVDAPQPRSDEKYSKSVYRLYKKIRSRGVRSRFASQVLKLLGTDTISSDKLQVFEETPAESQTPELRARAVRGYLAIGSLDDAADVHDELMSLNRVKRPHLHASTALILQLFQQHRWERMLLSFSARQEFQRRHPRFRKSHSDWLEDLAPRLKYSPKYHSAAKDMLMYFEHRQENSHTSIVIPDVFLSPLFRSDLPSLKKLDLLERARKIGLSKNTYLYEMACLSILQQNSQAADRLETALRCYQMVKESGGQPTEGLLLKFLHEAIENQSHSLVKFFEKEWQKVIGRPNTRFSLRMMKWFARQADVASCERLIKSHHADLKDAGLGFLYPLLHAEALRYGSSAVASRLQWIREELGFTPDANCWNIYLNALARADDLDGAQAVYEQMLEANVAPDTYTVGTLLGICGNRGDTQLARYYLRDGISRKVLTTDVMLESVALAYVNNDQIEKAIELAETLSAQSPTRAVRSWTQILAALAVRKQVEKALAVNARMNSLGVPFNGPAYAALMRVFTADGQPGMALRIMSDLMRRDKVPYAAIHYAILINGYADAGRFESGLRVHAQWLKDREKLDLKDSLAIRVALLKLQGLSAKQQMQNDNALLPGVRFEVAEELMYEFLEDNPTQLWNDKSPKMLLDNRATAEAQPSAYFDTLLAIYGRTKAVEMTKLLLNMLAEREKNFRSTDMGEWPKKVLYSIMRARFDFGDFVSVSTLWHSAIDMATKGHQNDSKDSHGLVRRLPRKQALSFPRHLDTHLLGLSKREAMTEMFEDLRAYRDAGFVLDNGNWNLYVRILAKHGYLVQAFALAEKILMPGFSGFDPRYQWKMLRGAPPVSTPVGHFPSAVRRGALFITYKTMQQLHNAFLELQHGTTVADQDEESGLPNDVILGNEPEQTVLNGLGMQGKPDKVRSSASHTDVASFEGSRVQKSMKATSAQDSTAATATVSISSQVADTLDETLVADESWSRTSAASTDLSLSERRRSLEDIEHRAPKLVQALRRFPSPEDFWKPDGYTRRGGDEYPGAAL